MILSLGAMPRIALIHGARMNICIRWLAGFCAVSLLCTAAAVEAQNQTATLSPVYSEEGLPYRIKIEQADFALPSGLHSYAAATFGGRWLMLAGRINGLHGFNNDNNNFPPNQQNTTVFVVDPAQKTVYTRSLTGPGSGLSQAQVDLLSVTSGQSYQLGNTLYMTGGYGVDTATGTFSTKDALSAIDVPRAHAVGREHAAPRTPQRSISGRSTIRFSGHRRRDEARRQWRHDADARQNFVGFYVAPPTAFTRSRCSGSDRRRWCVDFLRATRPAAGAADPNYRRRDLNIVPRIRDGNDAGWVALSGVFTLGGGAWTVPVDIDLDGTPSMPDPANPGTFKQAMNGYAAANFGLYSPSSRAMYTLLLGGISFGFFQNGVFMTDPNSRSSIRSPPCATGRTAQSRSS